LPFFNTLNEHDKYGKFIVRNSSITLVLWHAFKPATANPGGLVVKDPIVLVS